MNDRRVTKRAAIAFSMACIAAVAMVLLSEGSYWRATGTLRALAEVQAERTSAWRLFEGLVDAETGQRGYLMTGQGEFLKPYSIGVKQVEKASRSLDRDHADEPETMALLARIHRLGEARLALLAQTIKLYDSGKHTAAIELVAGGEGQRLMDELRTSIGELQQTSNRATASSRTDIYATLMFSRIGMAVLSALCVIALLMYLRQSKVVLAHQQELKQAIQAERDRLEIEVIQRTAQLTELTHHLQTAREDERNRLARNLHDELGALLTSAKLDAARIRSRLAGTAPEALERLAHLVETLNSSISLGRRIIEDLRPSTLGNLGLLATLEILAREFSEHSGIAVHCTLAPVRLQPSAELMVYRLAQEAITNISKYAEANQVWIELAARDGQVEVSVRDDGVGFDSQLVRGGAYGLLGMRFRVEAEGGSLTVLSAPGRGTELRASLPESRSDAAGQSAGHAEIAAAA